MSRAIGTALVFEEEEVRKTSEFLPRLIRIIFFALSITHDRYLQLYYQFYRRTFRDKSQKEFRLESGAKRKAILDRHKLTFNMMSYVLGAMGYDIESVSVRIRNRETGEVRTFSTDDTVEQIKAELNKEKEIGIASLE